MNLDRWLKGMHVERGPMPQTSQDIFAEEYSIVLVGNWNAAIFQPEWLCRHGLIGPEAAATAKIVVVSPQVTEFEVGHIHLQCTEDRLAVRVGSFPYVEQLLDLTISILRLLPHTPINACGINPEAQIHLTSVDYWHQIGHALAPKEPVWNALCEGPGMQKLVIQAAVSDWDYPLVENLSVEPVSPNHSKHPALITRGNLHFQVPPLRPDGRTAANLVEEFLASKWVFATDRAKAVANHIFESIPPAK